MADKTRSTNSVRAATVEDLVEQIGDLSVLELSELVGKLQEKLGVSAVPVAAPQPSSGQAAPGAESEEKATGAVATVVLTDAGANKINVIKALREINPQLGLKEAKDITEATPKEILSGVKGEEAKAAKEKLEAAGAKVELK